MKRKLYSAIIVISTCVSVNIMLWYDKERDFFLQYSYNNYNHKSNILENSIIEPSNKEVTKEEITKKEINKKVNEQVQENKDNSKTKECENVEDSISSNDSQDFSYNDDPAVETVTIFKVDKDTLGDKLTLADKAKLLYLSKKLSPSDFGKIKDYMDSSDEVGASTAIFKILKNKLSCSDYNEVLNILRPYMNVEYIDEHASN